MVALVSLLLVVFVSLLVVRIASSALKMTGLSSDAARFQARSAFTGTGFTTEEAESVVHHPVRRRIISILMVLRNAGIVSAIASLAGAFVNTASGEVYIRLLWLVIGLTAIWLFSISRWVDRWLTRLIEWALAKWTSLDVRDYASLLQLGSGYMVKQLAVSDDDWIAGRRLAETRLRDEGIMVLGVSRKDGRYLGAPNGSTTIHAGDTLTIYGKGERIRELDQRVKGVLGDLTHEAAVGEQEQEERKQDETERAATEAEQAEQRYKELAEEEEERAETDSEETPDGEGEGSEAAEAERRNG